MRGKERASIGAALAGAAARTLLTEAAIRVQNLAQFWPLLALQEKHRGVFQAALAQRPIRGELQAEADVLSKQCCHMCCKDERRILAFCLIRTQRTILSF